MNPSWQRRFFTFWIAQSVSLIGSNLAHFAITWWLTKATGSATILTTVTLVGMLPGVVLGPLAGVLVDRWNRRLIIIVADGVGALGAAALVWLFWSGQIAIWQIYVITVIRSLAGTFHFAAVQASTALLAPPEQLARVAGLNQTVQGINMVVAPPLGALLLELLSLHAMMAIDVLTALIAIVLVSLITIPQPRTQPDTAAPPSLISDLRSGLLYIWRWPGLLLALILSALINCILNPAFSLLPILVTDHFGGNALQFAALDTTLGLGFIGGGLLLSVWGGFKRRMNTTLVGLLGMAGGTLLIGLAPADSYWLAVTGLALFGLLNPIANGPFMAVMQTVVAPEMQGRFFTVLNSISQGITPLGFLLAGPLADAYGVQIWFLVGTASLLVMGAVIFFTPALMQLEDHRFAEAEVITTS